MSGNLNGMNTTDKAVSNSNNLLSLVQAAADDPQVEQILHSQFDSYSHSPIGIALTGIVTTELVQHNITVDSSLVSLAVGAGLVAVGYAWQWASMLMNKPIVPTTPEK
jgi:hypothetical protein